ncbi:MAG: acyltransferase family protein [Polyangiales bacterium]
MSEPSRPASTLRKFFQLELLDNRYPALHGLRVLAILTVIQFHVTTIFHPTPKLRLEDGFVTSSTTIFFGMDLFFMLSGFLIGSILIHSIDSSGSQQIARFYIRRVCRTFPSYYLVLTVLAFAQARNAEQTANLPFEYLYLTNFREGTPNSFVMSWGWSLALEEQFYLTVPLLFVILGRLKSDWRRVGFLVALWSVGLIVRLTIYLRHRPWNDLLLNHAIYFKTYTRFDTLIAGILLALVHRRWKREITEWLRHPLHRAIVAIVALTGLWLLLEPWMFGGEALPLVHVFAWGTITTLMYFAALILLLHSEGWIVTWLSRPYWRTLATLGYGVYLVHIPVIRNLVVPVALKLKERGASMGVLWTGGLMMAFVLSLAIGYLLHVFVEKPALRLRDWLAA